MLANAACAAATGLGMYLLVRMANQRWAVSGLAKTIEGLQVFVFLCAWFLILLSTR